MTYTTEQKERAIEIAEQIKAADTWDMEALKELCELAGMSEEWANTDGDTSESVAYAAADKLGVEIL